jgi:hypothetical protein
MYIFGINRVLEIRKLTNKLKDGLDILVASVALDILGLFHILLLLLAEKGQDLKKLRVRNYNQKPMFMARIHECCARAEPNPGNSGKLGENYKRRTSCSRQSTKHEPSLY